MPDSLSALQQAVLVANVAVLVYFAATAAVSLWAAAAAFARLRRARWRRAVFDPTEALSATVAPPVTILAPMYNEGAVCVEAVRALLGVGYPSVEVLVVNDGSKDETVARLLDAFDFVPTPRFPTADLTTAEVLATYRSRLRPNLWLLDKANGGKADALNAGLAHARTPLVCLLDGDSLLGRDALLRAVQPFLEDDDVVAAGGTIGVVNGSTVRMGMVEETTMPRSWLARFQVLEYLRAFASARVGWAAADALLIISGAFGVFRRDVLAELGGFDPSTVGEDMELVVRIHRRMRESSRPYRVAYVPEAVSWTECPESMAVLSRQRDRWHRGLAEILWRHRAMLFNPRYGRIGLVAYPAFLFVELLGPVIEAAGYVALVVALALGVVDVPVALLLLALALALGVVQSAAAVALEQLAFRRYTRARDVAQLLLLCVLENFGYRQLTVWWRLRGLWKFFRKDGSWGEMTRTGFNTAAPSPLPPS